MSYCIGIECEHFVKCIDHHPFGSTTAAEDNSYCSLEDNGEDCIFDESVVEIDRQIKLAKEEGVVMNDFIMMIAALVVGSVVLLGVDIFFS